MPLFRASASIPEFNIIRSVGDLPTAVGNVITLKDGATYFFIKPVDLGGKRLISGTNTTIFGTSSENSGIYSTGLVGEPFITSNCSLPMRDIFITADIALSLNAVSNPGSAIDWRAVNFVDCNTIGTIQNYNNFIMLDSAFLNSGNLTFDGSINTIGFNGCLLAVPAGKTGIIVPATAVIGRRFRIIYSAISVASTATGINMNTSAIVPVESYIFDACNFSGAGTYLSGVAVSDNKSLWENNKGIENTANTGYFTMTNNAVATDITATDTTVKVAGTTVFDTSSQKFTHSNNRLTYVGALSRSYKICVVASFTSGTNNAIKMMIYKNGSLISTSKFTSTANSAGRAENAILQVRTNAATNDYFEVFTENASGATDVTVTDMSMIMEALN